MCGAIATIQLLSNNIDQIPERWGYSIQEFIACTCRNIGTISPATFVLRRPTLDYSRMTIQFGAYAEVVEECQTTKIPVTNTLGAIALATYQDQTGSYPFLNINTGMVIYQQ